MTGPTEAHERGATMPESQAPDDGATTTDDATDETATAELADDVNPYEVVRVKTGTGAHVSMTRAAATARGATILEGRPAVGGLYGRPLPGKPKRDLTPADARPLFDPTGSSVAKVREYLDGVTDANEVARVLGAERAGKNRSTITSWSPTTSTTTVQED